VSIVRLFRLQTCNSAVHIYAPFICVNGRLIDGTILQKEPEPGSANNL
jgi:hypothetical protein